MRTAWLPIALLGWWHSASSQGLHGVEQYCMQEGKTFSVIPVVYYQTRSGWYGEVRFNYEAGNTVSFSAGKSFAREGMLSYSFTPVLGVLGGQLYGGFAGLNAEVDYGRLYLTSQLQYVLAGKYRDNDFAYNWTELVYDAFDHIAAGLVLQQTKMNYANQVLEPGLFLQLKRNRWKLPFYIFKPGTRQQNFALGVCYEWETVKRRL